MKAWKKIAETILLPALCAVLLLGALSAGARAVSTEKARLRPDYTIVIDGSARTFYNVSGQQVHPLSYHDTTYLPVRAIGELMGKVVTWNEEAKTVDLSGVRTGEATTGTPDTAAVARDVAVEVRDDFTVVVDGTVRTFADAAGKTVYPLLYQGSTYLPIRAIGELMGKTVGWDESTRTITLSDAAGTTVTDADVIVPGGTGSTPGGTTPGGTTPGGTTPSGTTPSGQISLEDAKAAALAHAGLGESDVTFTKQKLDREDGRQVYEIEFYTPAGEHDSSKRTEYEYEISASTGAVVKFDRDVGRYVASAPAEPAGTAITLEKAQEIALAKVPGAAAENIKKLKLDRDDGRQIYEVEIFYNGTEYEMEIDASTGTILEFESEAKRK